MVALTFLVISCPCALAVSVPMSFFGGLGGASKLGVLVKGGNYLEALAKLDTVVFDRRGQLQKVSLRWIPLSTQKVSRMIFCTSLPIWKAIPIIQSQTLFEQPMDRKWTRIG